MERVNASPSSARPQVYRDTPALALRRMLLSSAAALPFVVIVGWGFFGRDLGMLAFLLVIAALGLGGYLAFRPAITLVCTPDDFTLVHRNAFKVFYLQSHPWRDILNARYKETVEVTHLNSRPRTKRARSFALDLRDGYGVTFSESTGDFRGLIATVGDRTTHIPYRWVPAQGHIGRVAERGGDYALVPRAAIEAPPPSIA